MNKDEIIKIYNENKSRSTFKNTECYQEIIKLTSFLDKYYDDPSIIKMSQRMWHIKNDDYEVKRCVMCEKPLKFKDDYKKCCSVKCKKEYQKTPEHKELKRNITLKIFSERKEEIIEKQKKNNLKKYGVEYTVHLKKAKEKYEEYNSKRTKKEKKILTEEEKQQRCIEKWGVPYYFQSEEFKEKSRQTCLKKYGVPYSTQMEKRRNSRTTNLHYFQSEEFISQTEETFKNILHEFSDDYEYVKFVGNQYHTLKCKKCGKEFTIDSSFFNWRKKRGFEICTNCNPVRKNYSSKEKELLDYIKSIYSGEIIENNRKIIYPYELDIYLPELNLAIEYNGLFWHSSEKKGKDIHKIKSDLCKEKGVHLIHIFEDDWNYKQNICKSILSNFINQTNQTVIYARKCIIKEVSFKDINEFLEENHLLGKSTSFSKCYGLYYNDELVSLMSFRLISKDKNRYELNRYAIKNNYRIIGGAERLFKQFIKNVNYDSIITYNDNSVFKGSIYPKLGFKYIRTNSPNYMFITRTQPNKRFSKQSIRKLNAGFKMELEEKIGYLRVYNAGNDVYEIEK